MLILYDFACTRCETRVEKLVPMGTKLANCDVCHDTIRRVISPVRSQLEGLSGHFPDAADKWAKRHETEGRKPSETDPQGW